MTPSILNQRLAAEVARQTGMQLSYDHEPTLWLRNEISAIRQAAQAGRVEQCGHLAPGQAAAVALWCPDRAWCAVCVPAVALTGDADRTCDRCQRVGAPGELIHPCVVDMGPALLMLGLCPGCSRAEVPR